MGNEVYGRRVLSTAWPGLHLQPAQFCYISMITSSHVFECLEMTELLMQIRQDIFHALFHSTLC